MGEAKRRKLLPCICDSGRPAGQCCWTSRGYHKKPVVVELHKTGLTGKHANCYMSATGGCDTKISGEHLISEGVLKILAEKQVELSGVPWLKGQKRMLGFRMGETAHRIQLSWEDGLPHEDVIITWKK